MYCTIMWVGNSICSSNWLSILFGGYVETHSSAHRSLYSPLPRHLVPHAIGTTRLPSTKRGPRHANRRAESGWLLMVISHSILHLPPNQH